jgi:hypothetical protein
MVRRPSSTRGESVTATSDVPTSPVNVLWTGGWDSTFRVLQLSVERRRPVQPHYLLDADRLSLRNELRAIRAIRRGLAARDPEAAALILPHRMMAVHDIPPDPLHAERMARIHALTPLFDQYDFLTRYAALEGVGTLELGWHEARRRASVFLDDVLEEVDEGGGPTWRVSPDRLRPDDDRVVFLPLRFPILRLSKVEMGEAAERFGVGPLMERTWFCFRPRGGRRDQPCGHCPPCIDVMHDGLGRRLPRRAVVHYHLRGPWAAVRGAAGWLRAIAPGQGVRKKKAIPTMR